MTHCVTQTSRYSLQSLADRESSGGVEGSDARVIETYSNRKVDIRGMCNHEITVIPLETAEGVEYAITRELLLIMRQHACYCKSKIIRSSPQIENFKSMVDDRYVKVWTGCHYLR